MFGRNTIFETFPSTTRLLVDLQPGRERTQFVV